MTDLNEKMDTGADTGDQDFVELQAEDDLNDLDEENGEFHHNGGSDRSSEKTTEHSRRNASQSQPSVSTDEGLGLDSETEADETEADEYAETRETELMNMPSLQSVMTEMSQLKQKRRVLVHPIKVQELGHPKVLEIISKVSCEEIKLHFVRPQNKPEEWQGILLMHFGSTRSAQLATENLKSVRTDLNIRSNEETAYANRAMEQWVKDEKGQKRWTDTLLWVTGIPEDTTEDQLFGVFADAEDIAMCRKAGRKNSPTDTKDAFIVYHDGESAQNAAKGYQSKVPVINGHPLKVLKYHTPQETSPKGLLKLKERRLVLKYLTKLSDMKQKSESEGGTSAPIWCNQRLEKCQNLIDRDNRVRKSAGLPAPSLEEMRSQKGIKVFHGKECEETLQRLGILPGNVSKDQSSNMRKRSYNGEKDPEKPKIKSLLQLDEPLVSAAVSRSSRYPSLLGDTPSLFMTPSKSMSSQWTSPSLNQLPSANNPGFSKLLSANPMLSQMGSFNPSIDRAAFIKQQNAINFMNLLKQQQQQQQQQLSSNPVKGKTPLLASPDSVTPFIKSSPSLAKIPLLGMEPPTKMLRLDANGSFCYDFKSRPPVSKSSQSSKHVSLLDL